MIEVRRASVGDVPELVRLKELLMRDGWPWDTEVDDAWRAECARVATELLQAPHYAAFCIEGDGEGVLAACVTVAIEQHLPGPDGSGRSAYIGDMCTDAAYRGRGYGTRLLEAAMSWAVEQGAGWASLFATESGRSVYTGAGFAAEGPFEHLSRALD